MVCQRARALSFCLTDLFFKSYATSAHVHKGSLNGHLWKQLEQNFHMLDVLPSESKEALLSTSLRHHISKLLSHNVYPTIHHVRAH